MGLLRLLLIAAAVGLVVWLLARAARGSALCRIRVRGRRVEMDGALPGRARPEIVEFVESLGLPDGASIRAHAGDGSIRLDFNDAVPERERQRIRNFLMLRR